MTMDIYSHVLPTMQKDAMDRFNRAFEGWDSTGPDGREKPKED
jgi:hypothetical protein